MQGYEKIGPEMNQRINYLMSGRPHLPYLVASLFTLREHFSGEVVVYAYPESYPAVKRISEDARLYIEAREWSPSYRGKNGQFINKILMMQKQDCSVALYLDADTTIHGDLGPLFEAAWRHSFLATQFNNWRTNGRVIRKRIMRLRGFKEIDQEMVETILSQDWWPSPNGGVFACRPESEVLSVWHQWTMAARSIFIADETVLHVLQPKFVPNGSIDRKSVV